MAEKICKHLDTDELLAEEQKGCIQNSQGCKEQLIIDSVVLEQVHKDNRNLYTAYSDYRRAFHSVPHSWLIHVLQIYKIDPQIINSLQQLMKKWTTTLQVKMKNHRIMSDLIHIQRGIYQGDILSPLRFCLALNLLPYLLNRTNYGFGIHSGNQEMQRLNHILYVDDIKLCAATNNQLQELLPLTDTFSRDIKMVFGIEKCKTLCIAKRKLEMRNFTTEDDDDDTMDAMNEGDMYRYLDHMQAKQIKHVRMKHKLGKEYLNHTKNVLNTKLNGKNMIKAVNTYATPVLTFSFGLVKWTPTDLENLQTKMRMLLTRYRFHHPCAAKERLSLPRQMSGRGLIDITRLHDKQVKLLQTHFLNKQVTSSLRAAVVKADDRCTPLDLVRANQMNSPQMKNIMTKSRDNGPKKPCMAAIRMTSANNM